MHLKPNLVSTLRHGQSVFRTSPKAKRFNGVLRRTVRVECPSIVGALIRSTANVYGLLILALDGTTIENEVGYCLVCLPQVQLVVDVLFSSQEASERRDERLQDQNAGKVVVRFDCDNVLFQQGDVARPKPGG